MLKISLLLIATLFIQVHSWKDCANSECYFTETFENCGDVNECKNNEEDYSRIMEYYNNAYRYNDAKKQDALDLKLDLLYKKFNEEVEKGPRRCRFYKDYNDGTMCVNKSPSFYFYQPLILMDVALDETIDWTNDRTYESCEDFQQKLNTECNTAQDKFSLMNTCNVTVEFEEKVAKLWKKCVNYIDL